MREAIGLRMPSAPRSQQLLDWAGDSKERKLAVKNYCKVVLAGDFRLDQYSLAAIQKLAED